MKKHTKTVAVIVGTVIAASSVGCCLTGCFRPRDYTYGAEELNALADELAVALMGDDVITWNFLSATPKQSFGYEQSGTAEFYSYAPSTQAQLSSTARALKMYANELEHVDYGSLDKKDAVTYRAVKTTLDTYIARYSSPYARAFDLIGGDYITPEGGYIAEFATLFENYTFRTKADVDNLLDITRSTTDAFATYLDYADDRDKANYPLYDFTLTAMIDYLNSVHGQGESYYLYSVIDRKLTNASFLSNTDKQYYSILFKQALGGRFMSGVKQLAEGLEQYKGRVTQTEKSYLAQYGAAGRAYYEWCFMQKTGISNADMNTVYDELIDAYTVYYEEKTAVSQEVAALKDTDTATYDAFNGYVNGELALLDLTTPEDMLAYLKTAATDIVPSLKTEPDIRIKYMDETEGAISSILAYYVKTPIDEPNSVEYITINPCQTDSNGKPSELLTTMAHEGYPGHLYSMVNSKERGVTLISVISDCLAFSEGWANYVERVLLENIADGSSDKAVKLYCDYRRAELLSGYISMNMFDMQINYMGMGVSDFVLVGESEDAAKELVEMFMDNPTVYMPYGYGMYEMVKLHDKAKAELGEKYDEVQLNGALLSEGYAPTLERARKITSEYIASAKKRG